MAKKIRKLIENRVKKALSDLPKDLSDKKFKKHIKKAGKILSDGLELPAPSTKKKKNVKQSIA